jgi:hypothetical protein
VIASDIVSRARTILNDADGVRWLDAELLNWINDGQRMITLVRPDASVTSAAVSLSAGTKQTLPADALRILDVIRNIGADGSGGRAVRLVDRDVLDTQNPTWHADAGQAVVKNFVYDNRDPKTFYVYPPATAASKVEVMYSKLPVNATALSSELSVADIYADPLLNYVLHRAYSKDAEFAQNFELSVAYLQACNGLLGVKTQRDAAYSPDLNSKGKTVSPNPMSLQMGGV